MSGVARVAAGCAPRGRALRPLHPFRLRPPVSPRPERFFIYVIVNETEQRTPHNGSRYVKQAQFTALLVKPVKGVFSPNPLYFSNLPSSPHTSSHMFSHHAATVRLAGRKRHARFESSEALAELPAVARTAVELHGCCARVSLAAALLSQHIDGVARAGSAGTKSGSRARSLVLLTMLAPVVENRTVQGSATARRRSELGNRRPLRHGDGQLWGSSARRGVAIGDLPTSSVSAQRGPAVS